MTRAESYRYAACGLSLEADAPIPGARLIEGSGAADVRVTLHGSRARPGAGPGQVWGRPGAGLGQAPDVADTGPTCYVSPYEDERGVPSLTVRVRGSSYLFSYGEGARFLIDASGSQVDAWWDPPLTDADASDFLLGGVLAFIVRLRGLVPVHASAVAIDGRAVLFAGAAGAGKSSTAAAFATLGLPVLSDDVVTVADAGGAVLAYPASPRVSVWADSAQGLFASRPLPTHSAVYAKHRVDLLEYGYHFHESPAPIEAIFILRDRWSSEASPATRQLSPRAALMSLVTHSHGNYLLDASMRAREFDLLGRVAASVTVRELAFGDDLDQLVPNCRRLAGELGLTLRR